MNYINQNRCVVELFRRPNANFVEDGRVYIILNDTMIHIGTKSIIQPLFESSQKNLSQLMQGISQRQRLLYYLAADAT